MAEEVAANRFTCHCGWRGLSIFEVDQHQRQAHPAPPKEGDAPSFSERLLNQQISDEHNGNIYREALERIETASRLGATRDSVFRRDIHRIAKEALDRG